jgi:hypothetical protein
VPPDDQTQDPLLAEVRELIFMARSASDAWAVVVAAIKRLSAASRTSAHKRMLNELLAAATVVQTAWIDALRDLRSAEAELLHDQPAAPRYGHLLPPRVGTDGQQRTAGIATLGTGPAFELISGHRDSAGHRDRWAIEADQRLRECRLATWNKHHVEAKLVAVMRAARAMSAWLEVNNVPCGVEQADIIGCHQILPDMLAAGATLTVIGSYTDGTTFTYIYRGRGPAW